MKNKKLRIVVVVGTRPEIIRLSRIITKLDNQCNLTLVHTGQNYDYELNEVFFRDLEIRKPDFFLRAAKSTPSQTIGQIIIEFDKIIDTINPEALLVLGDTNSCLAAIPAKRNKIPIFHMEAGNRCFDMNVPEEINRKIVDHLADINITYSQIARDYLIKEGFQQDMVIKLGSPMMEVLNFYNDKIMKSQILEELKIKKNKYFLVSAHREENVDNIQRLRNILKILQKIVKKYDLPIIVSTHPRTKSKIQKLNYKFNEKKIIFHKPFGFLDYNNLQINAKAVISDSGTITEESSILKLKSLNLRNSHERPEGMEEGTLFMVGVSDERVMQALEFYDNQNANYGESLKTVSDYNVTNVSDKVIKIIYSYTDYVMKKNWHIDKF